MTEWYDDRVLLGGASGAAMFDELDDLLPLGWRLACFVPTDAWRREPDGPPYRRIEDWEHPPPELRYAGGWEHEHCDFFLYCTRKIMRTGKPDDAIGYVAVRESGHHVWLCRHCGEALLKWRETDECRAYMERRSAGVPGPPSES